MNLIKRYYLTLLNEYSVIADVFYEKIADSEIDKFIISLDNVKYSETHTIYHVAPEEELWITFVDDNLMQEEMSKPTIEKIPTGKGNEDTAHFIDTDTGTPNVSFNEREVTRKYNENVSERNNETFHPKDILPLVSSNNIYGRCPTSPRCFASSIDFNSNKYGRSNRGKSCAQNNKQDINLRNDIYKFLLNESHFLREEMILKNS